MQEQRRKQAFKKHNCELVFPSWKTGGRLTKLNSFKETCAKQGIEDCHFHDLRHTFASRLAEANINAFTIAELLGHKSLEMTLRYTHATDSCKREAVETLNNLSYDRVVTIWSQGKRQKLGKQ